LFSLAHRAENEEKAYEIKFLQTSWQKSDDKASSNFPAVTGMFLFPQQAAG
jgi:hypothetical protein